jgi:hypothetical protein
MGKNVLWTDQAKAQLRAIDQPTLSASCTRSPATWKPAKAT